MDCSQLLTINLEIPINDLESIKKDSVQKLKINLF